MKTYKITEKNYLKASRKASRELEISLFGHPLPKNKVHKSKKLYDRKKFKCKLVNLRKELNDLK